MQTGCSRCNLRSIRSTARPSSQGGSGQRTATLGADLASLARPVVVETPTQDETRLFKLDVGSERAGISFIPFFFWKNKTNLERPTLHEGNRVLFLPDIKMPRTPQATDDSGQMARRGPKTWGRSPLPPRSPSLGPYHGEGTRAADKRRSWPCSESGVITIGSCQLPTLVGNI